MGGKLLAKFGLPEKRISKEEYEYISGEIVSKILACGYDNAECPKVFKSKKDFGDIDVLVNVGCGHKPLLDFVKRELYPNPHKNGNVISFPYNDAQIDLISIGAANYEVAKAFFSYESGMAVGVVGNTLGLKFGWDGLHLKYPLNLISPELPAHDFFLVTLEKDPVQIYDILGFDYARLQEGFATKQDLFKWIEDSRYFDPKIFNLDELNHQNRIRNKKRPTYNELVAWVHDKEGKPRPSKSDMREYVIQKYPHVQNEIERKSEQIRENKERAAKFNGNLVRELTGLEGAALGKFIKNFKGHYSVYMPFEVYLDDRTQEMVAMDIKKMFDSGRK